MSHPTASHGDAPTEPKLLVSFRCHPLAGTHWVLMSFWLVALQSDIVAQPCRWRLFNILLGAVYIFCYVNVQPGPSKHRMAVFYVVSTQDVALGSLV